MKTFDSFLLVLLIAMDEILQKENEHCQQIDMSKSIIEIVDYVDNYRKILHTMKEQIMEWFENPFHLVLGNLEIKGRTRFKKVYHKIL